MIMATPKDLLDLLLTQDGDPYVFGVEVSPSDSNPKAFDCSELVQWGCARLGVKPIMPDGAIYQVRHCRKYDLLVPVDQAIHTSGALLFRFSDDPFTGDRPHCAHVAVSQGNGKTFEARGRAYGVGAFSALKRGWTHAGLIPGLDYGEPVIPSPPSPDTGEDENEEINGRIYRVTAEYRLNVRIGPGTEYDVWGELAHGDEVVVPDTAGWLPILMEDDTTGWVSRKFVEEAAESHPPTPTPSPEPTPSPQPAPGPISGGVAADQLHKIVPSLSSRQIDPLISALNPAMTEAKINTSLRQAAFIAQLAYESQGFTHFVENLNYRADRLLEVFGKYFDQQEAQEYAHQPEKIANRVYANRLGNGDEVSGDGWRYRGRGFIQLTGKDNYREAGNSLNLDLVAKPELAAGLEVGARVAGWYWTSRDLNPYADRGQFDTITKRISGGLNGLNERRAYYLKAKDVLGA
jgi:putative chitinase